MADDFTSIDKKLLWGKKYNIGLEGEEYAA
jgi:hypothetical protein